jgi:RNA polymerase sigma factor (sigma-70 family)
MIADADLLRRYVEDRNHDAFRDLVGRHLNLVYAAALRQVNGDAHLAQDVTQHVFTDLARRADTLLAHRVLAGWLFVSTRYSAAKLIRSERRRQAREQEVFRMNAAESNEADCDWTHVRPVLDEALAELADADRDAILLRFFEGRAFAEVGAQLRLTENTARMRVERALDKLRQRLGRRGVRSTTAALALALAAQGAIAAPAGLVGVVSGTALATAGVAGTAGVLMTFMSMSKLQLGIISVAAVTGTTAWVLEAQTHSALTREIAAFQQAHLAPATVVPQSIVNQRPDSDRFDEQKSRAHDAELAQLAADTAALQQQNAVNDSNARAAAVARVNSADALSPGQLDRFPQATARVAPKYPVELRKAGITGEVLVEFVVDASGAVTDAYAVTSTHEDFEAEAIAGVKQWKFAAGLKGGKPVNTRMQQKIAFSLNEEQLPTSNWF